MIFRSFLMQSEKSPLLRAYVSHTLLSGHWFPETSHAVPNRGEESVDKLQIHSLCSLRSCKFSRLLLRCLLMLGKIRDILEGNFDILTRVLRIHFSDLLFII